MAGQFIHLNPSARQTASRKTFVSESIRLAIVDDHDMLRRGMALALQVYDDVECVGEASNGIDAVRLCETLEPDVMLMDLVMPGLDGVEATRIIHQRCPQVKILVLTSSIDSSQVDAALGAGAAGWLYKNISIHTLITAIHSVYDAEKP
jgi:DNA-binding NarL/FixJ family response regulator